MLSARVSKPEEPMATEATSVKAGLVRGLGQLAATMIIVGTLIGSGIFIVSAESSRLVGAPGWLLLVWLLAGVMTITGSLCCGELAAMMPCAEWAVCIPARDLWSRRGLRIRLDVLSRHCHGQTAIATAFASFTA